MERYSFHNNLPSGPPSAGPIPQLLWSARAPKTPLLLAMMLANGVSPRLSVSYATAASAPPQ